MKFSNDELVSFHLHFDQEKFIQVQKTFPGMTHPLFLQLLIIPVIYVYTHAQVNIL